jgi:hypothetical protein
LGGKGNASRARHRCPVSFHFALPFRSSSQFHYGVQSKPQLLAWLTCDGVHIDPGSGKHTILGIFSNIQARHFPVTHPFMIWFLTITDCAPGQHKLKILMGLDAANPQPLLERPFESQSPLHRINLINEIRNLTFPQAGEYSLLIEIDDEPLLATSMTVTG